MTFSVMTAAMSGIPGLSWTPASRIRSPPPERPPGRSGEDEIRVLIGRDGCLLRGEGGGHRLAIARLLGVAEVPVVVDGVHYRWARQALARHSGTVLSAVACALAERGAAP